MVGENQSWVTIALNDTSAWQALVLAKSLKRNFTSRRFTVLVSEDVSLQMRYVLRQQFDLVSTIESYHSDLNKNGPISGAISKSWCWNVGVWDKCVYVDSNSIALHNIDDLFCREELSAVPSMKNRNQFTTSLFVYKPNCDTFEDLLQLTSKFKNEDELLNMHFNDWSISANKQLDASYACYTDRVRLANDAIQPKLVQFIDAPWKLLAKDLKNDKLRQYCEIWHEIYSQDVLPIVSSQKKPVLREFLLESLKSNSLPVPLTAPVTSLEDAIPDLPIRDSIAIIGMSCRFPGADTPEEFWNVLAESAELIKAFPNDRHRKAYIAKDHEKPDIQAGFLKCAVDEFDNKFFGISPREAPFIDPQQRILLEVTWESLENAGINPQTLKESDTGVFMGIWQQEYDRILPDYGITANDFHHRYLGNAFSATASRISYFLGLNGPNLALESGCSSSLGGLHLACESLRKGEISLAISSGVNLVLTVENPLSSDSESFIISPTNRCHTFDESADGFVRAEGCAVLILKRFADAFRDGDNIMAVIRGSALNNDGAGTSFGTPNAKSQERVIREALTAGKVKPNEVSYIEAHGTGTAVGDPTEVYAISQVYAEERKEPLLLSSVKTNIGHAESAAGIAGVVKVLLCLQNKAIPPHLGLKTLNPRIDLESIPAVIPMELTPWKGPARIAGVSSFSMSGTNVHMLIQESPLLPEVNNNNGVTATSGPPKQQIVTFSTKSEEALGDMCRIMSEYLQDNATVPLEDIAYIANTGRAHLPFRIAAVAKDTTQLASVLQKRAFTTGRIPAQKHKIGFLFTGQGSQYLGMAKALYTVSPVFRAAMDQCETLFQDQIGYSLQEVIWNDKKLLEQTIYCQPALFCIQYALVQVWKHFGIQPDYVLGHSVGEFGAAVAAGVVELEDAMKLVVERSRLVNGLKAGSMMALKTSLNTVTSLISRFQQAQPANMRDQRWIDLAAINSPEEVVVSSTPETMNLFAEFCGNTNSSVKTQMIPASHAFHSRDMVPVMEKFGQIAASITYQEPNCTYISGTLAKMMDTDDFNSEYWQQHLRDTVRFADAIQVMWTDCKILVEIGAQPILLGLAMANTGDVSGGFYCPSLRKTEDDWQAILTTLGKLYIAGVDIDWKNAFGVKKKKVMLPNYPFQRQKFWYKEEEGTGNSSGVSLNTRLLHPLLGRELPSAVSDSIFSHCLKLKELSYIEDHKVADRIIIPATAFLETVLAAGREVLQCGAVPVPLCVEQLTIEAALELVGPTQVQTIVRTMNDDEEVKYNVAIHRQVAADAADKWKRHAQGVFVPCIRLPVTETIDIDQLKSRLQVRDAIDTAYQKIAEAGIAFGPRFQSIAAAWTGPTEVLTQVNLPEGSDKYICHPIVLDAMIQTFAFKTLLNSNDPEITKELQLPLSVRKFLWLSRLPTNTLYVHTKWEPNNTSGGGESCVILYSEEGEQLAIMEGIELIRTSVDLFLRILNSETIHLPDFYKDYWRPMMGITSSRIDVESFTPVTTESPYTAECYANDTYRDTHEGTEEIMSKMVTMYILKCVRECGWFWEVGKPISQKEWVDYSPAKLPMDKIVNAWVELLIQDGCLSKDEVVLRPLPSVDECDKELQDLSEAVKKIHDGDDPAVLFVKRCGQHLTQVCQGKINSLAVLFPEDSNEYGASRFYNDSEWYKVFNTMSAAVIADIVTPLAGKGHGVLRVCEVGAGTGATTNEVLSKFSALEVYHQYDYTDISPMFLAEAGKRFASPSLSCKVLNIEEDPLSQGYIPSSYDMILGTMVIHAVKDMTQTMMHLRSILKDGGLVVITDMFETMPHLTLTFGLLEGWWRYEDKRTQGPIASEARWLEILHATGFEHVRTIPLHNAISGTLVARARSSFKIPSTIATKTTWLVFDDRSSLASKLSSKLVDANRNVLRIYFDGKNEQLQETSPNEFLINTKQASHVKSIFENVVGKGIEGIIYFIPELSSDAMPVDQIQEDIIRGVLNTCQTIMEFGQYMKPKPRILEIAKGIHYIGDTKSGNPNAGTAWGLLKTFSNENHDLPITLLDLDQNEPEVGGNSLEETISLMWVRDGESFVALREGGKKYVARFNYLDKFGAPLALPNTDRFKFINPPSGSFADIQFGPASRIEVGPEQIEVAVQSCALNFKDLFVIMKPEGFVLPAHQKAEVGIDISGIVTAVGPEVKKLKVGDEIYGCTMDGGLQSHVVLNDYLAMKKPNTMSFSGAATMPTVFLTAYYSLVYVGRITKDDRVLIHVASGGVGLAAIQICQYFGAEMYTTAGSHRKRDYLRGMGLKNVYHSRNTSYGEEIRRDTNGKGVTLVLNSLTGPNFKETTLENCTHGARFLEIAKMNIWQPEEVQALRPDVEYTVVDLGDLLCEEGGHQARKLLAFMNESFDTGVFTSLPHTVFALEQAKEAFHHFQEAKHIGKIVVNIPKPVVTQNGKLQLVHQVFNRYSTYLVTGGLGGLGMEVARWMLGSGAEHIVLCGRNPPDAKSQELIDNWNGKNTDNGKMRVWVFQTDVGEYEQCVSLLQMIKEIGVPPLRGIFHAAGVLSDATIPNQTWEKFNMVMRPKVYGGWYLHSLTHGYELDMFVMFSSMACIHGMLGQSNHSAANRYLDSLTHYRLSKGLHACTVNWGPWSDVGAAASIKVGLEGSLGLKAFSPAEGIAALEQALRYNVPQCAAIQVSDWSIMKQFYAGSKYTSEIKTDKSTVDDHSKEYQKLMDEVKAAAPEDRAEKISHFLETLLRQTLRLPDSEAIDPDQNFSELGVDSLMAMEMRNRLQGMLGDKTLTISALQENRTLRSLSNHLANLMNAEPAIYVPMDVQLKEDSILPEDIQAAAIGPVPPSQFKSVLLTGATGHLGLHILVELCNYKPNPNLKVYCMVRGKTVEEAQDRLIKQMTKYELMGTFDMDKIQVLPGDLTSETLGFGENYAALAAEVDGVIHCAIKSNHLEGYSEGNKNDMRSHNVVGTMNVIRFAGTLKTKPILYASSLLAVTKVNENGILHEDYPDEEDIGIHIKNGYTLTKFVCEKLFSQAEARGIPSKVLRYASIFGHSVTGYLPTENNHSWFFLVSCLRARVFPKFDHNGLPIMAADIAAQITVNLFLSDAAEHGVYNLTSASDATEEDIQETVSEFGFTEQRYLPFSEWRDEVFKDSENALQHLTFLYEDDSNSATPRYLSFHPLARTTLDHLRLDNISEKLRRNHPNIDELQIPPRIILHRHLSRHFNMKPTK